METAKSSPYVAPTLRPFITTDSPLCISDLEEGPGSVPDSPATAECGCPCGCVCVCDYPCICPGDCSCPCTCPCGLVCDKAPSDPDILPSDGIDVAYVLAPDHRVREEEIGTFLFSSKTLRTSVLNETGSWVLHACLAGIPTRQILERSTSVLGDSRAPADVREVIGSLKALGALEEKPSSVASLGWDAVRAPRNGTGTRLSVLRAPNTVWWDVTNRCNLDCLHCYSSSSSGRDNGDELTTEEARGLIAQLSEMGVFGIYFLGGEPLIRPDFLDLVEHARERGLGVTMSSNGWMVDRRVADRLAGVGIGQVRISIDGATPSVHDWQRRKEGSFARACRAVRTLRQSDVAYVGVVTTLTRRNVLQAGAIIDLAHELGAHAIQILVVAQSGRGKDNYAEIAVTGEQASDLRALLREKQAEYSGRMHVYSNDGLLPSAIATAIRAGLLEPDFMGCQAARTCCNIDYNGDVIPCLLVRRPVAGNVRSRSFAEIWRDSAAFANWRRAGGQHEECRVCGLHSVCSRECPLSETQQSYGTAMRIRRIQAWKPGSRTAEADVDGACLTRG